MFDSIKGLFLRLVRIPPEPAAPEGSASSLRVFRASRRYWHYRLVAWGLGQAWVLVIGVAMLVALSRGMADSPPMARRIVFLLECLGWAGLLGGLVLSYVVVRLDYELRWYMVTDRSLRIREGVLEVHEMTMTFANIQNISISQGPLQRLLGIADLRVQSAGGGGTQAGQQQGKGQVRDLHVGFFRGVDDAPAIRDLVLQRLRLLKDAGLGDHEDDAHAEAAAPSAAGDMSGLLPALQELRDETRRLREVVSGG